MGLWSLPYLSLVCVRYPGVCRFVDTETFTLTHPISYYKILRVATLLHDLHTFYVLLHEGDLLNFHITFVKCFVGKSSC